MIIAEICQNHNGSMDLVRRLVEAAANAGATYCKIQSFFADDLSDGWDHDRERLRRLELSWEEQAQFVKMCKLLGMTPITSVYSTKYIRQLRAAGFAYIKVGSAQAMDAKLITTLAAAEFKVIVSTGGHDLSKLPRIQPLFGVLHCVSKYPALVNEADLSRMIYLSKLFPGAAYGFSDHTNPKDPNWDLPAKLAIHLGARLIEKHFTILARNETKDGPVSIDTNQLKELVRFSKLTANERLAEVPCLGLFHYPKDAAEIDTIQTYSSRWK